MGLMSLGMGLNGLIGLKFSFAGRKNLFEDGYFSYFLKLIFGFFF
jgi:hypothetical protein